MASTVGRIQDLVIEDGEVKGQSETDGVSRGELSLSDVGGALGERYVLVKTDMSNVSHGTISGIYLVGLMGSSSSNLALLSRGELGEVAVVVTLPIDGEMVRCRGLDEIGCG